ncbi:hypothetical protein ACD591_07170 [Rufibacter glacialis]|uniref:Uncharacterized protein n=1 Tax=Rufibacter glacialis TaxID=1259555 RepID=A0A5M8QBT9_9BACT|nr:hypothetical protein [Rufibacter glacialis]KAA6433429.1 hypothetical protein FOE74_13220 [Rufibacter glacialis]GGK74276.1 hypothetical protein GCM10011405_22930 [Rufibacter glacialis]
MEENLNAKAEAFREKRCREAVVTPQTPYRVMDGGRILGYLDSFYKAQQYGLCNLIGQGFTGEKYGDL